MRIRIEIELNDDSAQNVILYYDKMGDALIVMKELIKQGYVLKVLGEMTDE